MRLRLIAVGTRMPDWVDAAFSDYWRRMRGLWKLELIELPTASGMGIAVDKDKVARYRVGGPPKG